MSAHALSPSERARVRHRRSMRGVTVGARSRVRHRLVRRSRRKQRPNTGLSSHSSGPAPSRNPGGVFIQTENKTRTSVRAGAAIHPCCSSHSSGSSLREIGRPGAPRSLSLWSSDGEEGTSRAGVRTMEGMQAYGAGKAGGAFDPITFFKQPQTIIRIVSWVSQEVGGSFWESWDWSTPVWYIRYLFLTFSIIFLKNKYMNKSK